MNPMASYNQGLSSFTALCLGSDEVEPSTFDFHPFDFYSIIISTRLF